MTLAGVVVMVVTWLMSMLMLNADEAWLIHVLLDSSLRW